MSLVLIALTLAVIHCAIDEWKTGMHQAVKFSETPYSTCFADLLYTLKEWEKYTIQSGLKACETLRRDLLKVCRTNAGIVDSGNDSESGSPSTETRKNLLSKMHFARWE
ncbi:hypothetical protein CERSUDRAFT_99814 [Gelatoporia subvermispora B]|uniref:DUF6532 domain-containing protein n=1 Tax=Ceriporiopsis subvermispora (strain B) TaxID=914234 RepID=M2P9K8_CERS8|nr:hypothetical protein CERSUDRAFT_99814 [Gelatoporia subvermispora B]